jgi:hypothetical protein
VPEVAEDLQGPPPGGPGLVGMARCPIGVAEIGEGFCLLVAVADVAEQLQGVPVAGDGLVVMAEVVVGVAEAVPGGGLGLPVSEFLQEFQCTLAIGECLTVVPEEGMVPADGVEGSGVAELVSYRPEQLECLQVVGECFPMAALGLQHGIEEPVSPREFGPVAELSRDFQGEFAVRFRGVEAAEAGVGTGEPTVGAGLLATLAGPPGGVQGGLQDADPVMPVPPAGTDTR